MSLEKSKFEEIQKIVRTRSKQLRMTSNSPDVNDIVTSEVALLVNDRSDTTLVTTTGEHDKLTLLEGDNLDDLVLGEVELDRVSNLDDRVGVTDGASIVGNDERNTLGSELNLLDLEKLVGSLLLRDSVDGEATLDVVKETEVLSRLLDRDDIYN